MVEDRLKGIILGIYLFVRGVALAILGCFIGRDKRYFEKKSVRKILVIRMGRLGDFVVTTPLLKILRRGFPSSKITLLARRDICELAAKQPWIDDVIACDKNVSLFVFLEVVRNVRKGGFDLAVDCLKDYPIKTAVLAYLTRAPYRIGFDIANRGVFFNLKVGSERHKGTAAEEMLSLANKLGIIPMDCEPEIVVNSSDKSAVNDFITAQGIGEGSFLVGVHPGGNYPSQRWSASNFAGLIDRLYKNFNIDVVLLGNSGETVLLESIKSDVITKIHIFCTDSLNLLAAMIDRTQLFIGNNSGPIHLAAALGKRTVSTMGPTDKRLWAPAGKGHIVIKKDVECSPCNRSACKDHGCMELITIDEMFAAVSLQIKRIRSGNG